MFWKKNSDKKNVKLTGPKDIPQPVSKYLLSKNAVDEGSIPFLKMVQKLAEKEKKYEIRIFDPADAEARKIKVADYNTLTEHPEMIMAEGWYDELSKQAELNVKIVVHQPKLLSYEEVLAQIETLKEPGSQVFFFTSAGSGSGGPLGRGAAVIKLNAPDPEKKLKKYSVYGTSVVNMQPVMDQSKTFDSNDQKQIAKWVAESQKPRFC
jgi:hypothetical protein